MKKVKMFSASWCGACKIMAPIMQNLVNQGKIKLEYIDVDTPEGTKKAQEAHVRGIPVIFKENGESKVGSVPEAELKQWLGVED